MKTSDFAFSELRDLAEEVTFGRRKKQTRVLKAYEVSDANSGAKIGVVFEKLTSFESRTPGRRWVNYRWESPRWYYSKTGNPKEFSRWYFDTRIQASEALRSEVQLSAAMEA